MASRFSLLSTTYTIDSSTNTDTDYPATRLTDLLRPRRAMRSTSTTAPVTILDFGSGSVSIAAFSLDNCNYGTLTLASSADKNSWSTVATATVSGTDPDDGRRKAVIVPSSPPMTARYLRLTPSSLDSGATYYETGSFGAWGTLTTMARQPALPFNKQLVDKAETLELGGGGLEVGTPTGMGVFIDLEANFLRVTDSAYDEWLPMARVPRDRVWLFWADDSDVTQAYHVQRVGTVNVRRSAGPLTQVTGLQIREVI